MKLSTNPTPKIENRINLIKKLIIAGDFETASNEEHELLTEVIKAFDAGVLNIHDGLQTVEIISILAECLRLDFPRSFE